MTDEHYHAYQKRLDAARTRSDFQAIFEDLSSEDPNDPDTEAVGLMAATLSALLGHFDDSS